MVHFDNKNSQPYIGAANDISRTSSRSENQKLGVFTVFTIYTCVLLFMGYVGKLLIFDMWHQDKLIVTQFEKIPSW
jgi:hypothetical protein